MIFWKNWKWWCDMVFIWLKIFEIFLSARKTAFVSTTTTIIIIHARIMTYLLLIIFVGISKQEKNSSCIPILRFIRAKKINKCDYWRNISGQCSFLQTQQKELWFWAQLYTSLMEYYLFQCMQGGFAFSKCLISKYALKLNICVCHKKVNFGALNSRSAFIPVGCEITVIIFWFKTWLLV